MIGFSCNFGSCSIMQAELWGICKRLQIAVANGFQRVVVETDSSPALKHVKDGCAASHPCSSIVDEIKVQIECISFFG
ncbi:hypothetical protein AHAS_Ahas17G0158400 [Arachis hypogaea]